MVSQGDAEASDKDPRYLPLRIRKRPWYIWLLRAAWVLWLLLWLEFAIGSWREHEPHAFSIAARVLIVSLLLGLGLYFWKLREEKKTANGGTEVT